MIPTKMLPQQALGELWLKENYLPSKLCNKVISKIVNEVENIYLIPMYILLI